MYQAKPCERNTTASPQIHAYPFDIGEFMLIVRNERTPMGNNGAREGRSLKANSSLAPFRDESKLCFMVIRKGRE